MTDDALKVIEKWDKLIRYTVYRYRKLGWYLRMETEDLYQHVAEAMCRKPEAPWGKHLIRFAVVDAIRTNSHLSRKALKKGHIVKFCGLDKVETYGGYSMNDFLERVLMTEAVVTTILNWKDSSVKRVMIKRLKGLTSAQAAAELGLSEPRVFQLINEGIQKIRKQLFTDKKCLKRTA